MVERGLFEVEDRFLQQVYRLTTILALIATAILWAVYGLPGGLSFAIGSLFSLSAILSLEFVIRRMVKPGGSPRAKRWLGFIALGKYTVIFAGFYFLMKANWLNVYALAAGVGLVQVVIILKAVGMMIGILFKSNTTEDN
ncbi:MAG: ATP synthase subunit I [Candidatus Poribacteria bacterium]|nr:ATP synthase subunit I [Candidatus Poribacteria bacterium]